jgi:solute carrier family 25 citrate transporter 1
MAPPNHQTPTPPIISIISGGTAGAIEAAATYPFEFAKTRAQLHDSLGSKPPRNPFLIISRVAKTEGIKSLYKGCGALVIGSVGKDAVRFLGFDTVKNAFRDKETGALSPGNNMLAGMSAGVMASFIAVTPTERIKTALIDDARDKSTSRYTSTIHCIRSIIAEDGFKGLYRGLVGTTLKQASSTSFRMGSYNIIKDSEEVRGVAQTTVVNFGNGAVAGTITTLCTMPFDTVKTRSQAREVTTTREAILGVWRDEGLKGYWRGTVMRGSRTVFSGGILFTTAEAVANVLNPIFGVKSMDQKKATAFS